MRIRVLVAIASGVLSLLVIHFAFWLNVRAGNVIGPEFICNPYLEGCVSTSRAVRSGPGLVWFKWVMLPVAVLMALTWRFMGAWMGGFGAIMPSVRRWTVRLGMVGAVALVFYVIFLGTEGPVYSWLRRYGVVFFFGFTALAQLMATRFIWGNRFGQGAGLTFSLLAVVSLQWAIGVFSVFKRLLFDDPQFIDRLENITEWFMVLCMSLVFVLLGLILRQPAPDRHTA